MSDPLEDLEAESDWPERDPESPYVRQRDAHLDKLVERLRPLLDEEPEFPPAPPSGE